MKHAAVLFGCLVVVMMSVSIAQETTGNIVGFVTDPDGLPLPGVKVEAHDLETGFSRTVQTDASGRHRLPAMPPATYTLDATGEGFRTYRASVTVQVGQTVQHDISMVVGAFSDVVEVDAGILAMDARSTVSGITVVADDKLAQIPIHREATQIALLAPGTFQSPAMWELPEIGWGLHTPGQTFTSVAGASIGENAFVVNGLNISNFRYGLGASYVPMVFVDEVQVKTGGFEAEFGRATGGVINMVTKSGTNTFRGGLSIFSEPASLQENEADTVFFHNHREERETLEGNGWIGGPIVRDRLFFFAFLQYTDHSHIDNLAAWAGEIQTERSTPYWGGKIDWLVAQDHRLEGTFFSDSATVTDEHYDYDPFFGRITDYEGPIERGAGGNNFVLKYSGVLRDNLLLSAAVGRNRFDRWFRSGGAACPAVIDYRNDESSAEYPGCDITWWYTPNDNDTRTAIRADVDWYLGDHSLRFGADHERNESVSSQTYSGGVQYVYHLNGQEGADPSTFWAPDSPWDQDIAFVSYYNQGGVFDSFSSALYAQDTWAVRPGLTVNFGLRWESYDNRNGLGETFIETNSQWAPRLGVVWDPGADGRSKLFGSAGIYYLPVYSKYNIYLASAVYNTEDRYLFDGQLNDDGSPVSLGEEFYSVVWADGTTPDPREVLSENFGATALQQVSVGYERMLGEVWTVGVRGVAQRFDRVLEDYSINLGLYDHLGVECANPALTGTEAYCGHAMRLGNPGSDFQGWYDVDGDGELDRISIPADALGIPEAKLTNLAVELTATRRFSKNWMVDGSYTWSHTYGNYGGSFDSDIITNNAHETSSFFDSGTLMENSYGDLAQDRRHNFKAFGMYSFDFGLDVGGGFFYRTGAPINSYGRHPWDPFAQAFYNPYANVPQTFYTAGEPRPRGCCGRTDDLWNLDLMLSYRFRGLGGQFFVRGDVFNVTNNQASEMVWDFAEFPNGYPSPVYGQILYHQRPRTVRLGLGWSF